MPLLPPPGIGDFRVVTTFVTLTAAAKVVAANSATRISLLMGVATGAASVSTLGSLSGSQGIPVSGTIAPLDLNWSTHGALVNQQWWGISTAGAIIAVTEVFYEPKPREGNFSDQSPLKTPKGV